MGLNVGKNLVNQAMLNNRAQKTQTETKTEAKEVKTPEVQDKSGSVKANALDVLANQNRGLINSKAVDKNNGDTPVDNKPSGRACGGPGAYTFRSVSEMGANFDAGAIPNGSVCRVMVNGQYNYYKIQGGAINYVGRGPSCGYDRYFEKDDSIGITILDGKANLPKDTIKFGDDTTQIADDSDAKLKDNVKDSIRGSVDFSKIKVDGDVIKGQKRAM